MSLIWLVWPTKLNNDLGALGRSGRVAHWVSVAMSVGLLCAAITLKDWSAVLAIAAVGVYGFGRASRYLLAGE